MSELNLNTKQKGYFSMYLKTIIVTAFISACFATEEMPHQLKQSSVENYSAIVPELIDKAMIDPSHRRKLARLYEQGFVYPEQLPSEIEEIFPNFTTEWNKLSSSELSLALSIAVRNRHNKIPQNLCHHLWTKAQEDDVIAHYQFSLLLKTTDGKAFYQQLSLWDAFEKVTSLGASSEPTYWLSKKNTLVPNSYDQERTQGTKSIYPPALHRLICLEQKRTDLIYNEAWGQLLKLHYGHAYLFYGDVYNPMIPANSYHTAIIKGSVIDPIDYAQKLYQLGAEKGHYLCIKRLEQLKEKYKTDVH